MNGNGSNPKKTIVNFYEQFLEFMGATQSRIDYFNEIQVSMFTSIEKRLSYEAGVIANNIMNGEVSIYIQTLAIEKMFSETSGKSMVFVDKFVDQLGEDDYKDFILPIVMSMRGSRIEVIKIIDSDPEKRIMLADVYRKGEIIRQIAIRTLAWADIEKGSYLSVRVHSLGDLNITSQVSLRMTPEEIELSASDSRFTEFDLWIERVLEDECKHCDSCKENKALGHKQSSDLLKMISVCLPIGDYSETLGKEAKAHLYASHLEPTIRSIKEGSKDPRKMIRIAEWIKNAEAEMEADPELSEINTDWIWNELGLQGLRYNNNLH